MGYSQTFPDGKTLTSSALTSDQFTSLLQQATCFCFGLMNAQPYSVTLDSTSNQVVVTDLTGINVYFKVADSPGFGLSLYGAGGYGAGGSIPPKTTITGIDQATNTLTLSAKPTVSGSTTIFITNPLAGRLVRQEWPSVGAPGWDKSDDIAFLRAEEVDDWYNKVRDESTDPNDSASAVLNSEYTRVWRVTWNLYGPNAYSRATLIKSALQLDFIHDSLQASNVYLRPDISNPRRFREEFEGQWWERTDLEIYFYEQVNESIVIPTVASVEVQVSNENGLQLDLNIGA